MTEFRRTNGVGRLICDQHEYTTRYVLHLDTGTLPVMVELIDRPKGIACDEQVQLMVEDGRVLRCRILDDTPMCTVVGNGWDDPV